MYELNLLSTTDQNRSYSAVKDTQHRTPNQDHPFQLSVWDMAHQQNSLCSRHRMSRHPFLYRIVPIYAFLPGKTGNSIILHSKFHIS